MELAVFENKPIGVVGEPLMVKLTLVKPCFNRIVICCLSHLTKFISSNVIVVAATFSS